MTRRDFIPHPYQIPAIDKALAAKAKEAHGS